MDNIQKISAEHTYATWRRQRGFAPLQVVKAEGSHFTDVSGRRFLDLSSQLICSTLGHGNRAVIDAIKDQAEQLAFVAPGYTTLARAELSQELLTVLPKGLEKFFFTTSGSWVIRTSWVEYRWPHPKQRRRRRMHSPSF